MNLNESRRKWTPEADRRSTEPHAELRGGEPLHVGQWAQFTEERRGGAQRVDVRLRAPPAPELTRMLARDQRRMEQLQTLARAGVALNTCNSPREVFRVLGEMAQRLVRARIWVVGQVSARGSRGACEEVCASEPSSAEGRSQLLHRDEAVERGLLESRRPVRTPAAGIRASVPALGVPLIDRDGTPLGMVRLWGDSGAEFTEDDEAVVVQLAQMASAALQSTRLLAETQHSNARLDALFSTVPALVGVLEGPELRYVLANPGLRALIARERLIGRSAFEVHDHPGCVLLPRLKQVLESGELMEWREANLEFQGEERIFNLTFQPLRHRGAQRVVLFGVEVTDQVRARRDAERMVLEQQSNEARFRALVQATTAVVWTASADGRRVEPSPSWLSFTGQNAWAYQAEGFLEAVHPDDRARLVSVSTQAAARALPYEVEYRLRRAGGGYAEMLERGTPVFTAEGEVREYVGCNVDITQRRHVEGALSFLAAASAELSSSLDLDSVLAGLGKVAVPAFADWCCVYLADEQGVSELRAVHHRDPKGAVALRRLNTEYALPPEFAHGHPAVLRNRQSELICRVTEPLLQELSLGNAVRAQLLREASLGSLIGVPLTRGNCVFGVLSFGRVENGVPYQPDDLVLAEEVARRASVAMDNARLFEMAQTERRRVEDANRHKDEFLAMVSHELRTPLTAVLGWVKLLRDGDVPSAKKAQALEIIERNAQSQARLIEDLLDVSRIIAGKLQLNLGPVRVLDTLKAAAEAVRPSAEAKGVRLTLDLSTRLPSFSGDPQRIQQVVWNLLTNAVKFTPKGGEVVLSLRREHESAVIVVRDTGRGIAPEFLPWVFERFRQADATTTRNHGGLGLGLAIVKHLVELHGGEVSVHSDGPQTGATFTVKLPLAPKVAPPVPALSDETGTADEEKVALNLQGVRVLIVDDEEDVREVVAAMLERRGIQVTAVGSAAEAYKALASFRPDVLISDIAMPEEDGYALIRKVRATERERRTPALAMTAYARTEDRTRALLAGFQMHLAKPVTPAELLVSVATLAGRL